LRTDRQIANLVEKQCSAIGHFEAPLARRYGTGEGTALVAEQLRLQHAFGKGGTVDLDERGIGATAVVVDEAGDEFLAGAAFPLDQDAGVRRCNLFRQVEYFLHGRGFADHMRRGVAFANAAL